MVGKDGKTDVCKTARSAQGRFCISQNAALPNRGRCSCARCAGPVKWKARTLRSGGGGKAEVSGDRCREVAGRGSKEQRTMDGSTPRGLGERFQPTVPAP